MAYDCPQPQLQGIQNLSGLCIHMVYKLMQAETHTYTI